jgi:SAM-dependent methyltransferase
MRLNLGSGKEVREGFDGVDKIDFGQQYIKDVFPFLKKLKADSVDEAYSRYLLPCFTKGEINIFFNELCRVLKPGATFTLILPAWNAAGGYGHPHFQTEIKEGFFYFLNKDWRVANAPEVTDLTCDFDPTWGYNMHPAIVTRNQEYQQFALSNYCNSALDIICTLKKRVPSAGA